MRTHQEIDRRALALARAVVAAIDADPERRGFAHARTTCTRWHRAQPSPATREWLEILDRDWPEVRALLLADDEDGRRRRQNSPFTGVLGPRERWAIYRRFADDPPAA